MVRKLLTLPQRGDERTWGNGRFRAACLKLSSWCLIYTGSLPDLRVECCSGGDKQSLSKWGAILAPLAQRCKGVILGQAYSSRHSISRLLAVPTSEAMNRTTFLLNIF
ncbi:hypothetical protein EmuJ_000162400 [Echinococcus multilocularis]|uniref:Uncharacterized protein n=1 Tax=Echinococcus multilocularis TaxID=6211 RepID=A0A087VZX1_ECHMU|nr:hypothetical protein EmuJ_000162400 [Echinococcus multilocularis]